MIIRQETWDDIADVRAVHELAFGQPLEANIVDKLRDNCEGLRSLVAVENGKVVGHILFSPAEIDGPHGIIQGMGFAPMAVLPDMQRRGIGTQLIHKGVEELRKLQCPFIIVLSSAIQAITRALALKGRPVMGYDVNGRAYRRKHS